MSIVIEDERIKVVPEDVSVNDFLEYAELALERFGWRSGERKKVTGDDMVEIAKEEGLSLHDAIGYTNVMLGGEKTGSPTSKDAGTSTFHGSRAMRDEMTKAVAKVLPKGEDDLSFNDKAKGKDAVVAVLRQARGAA